MDSAELRVKERKDLTLNFWRNSVDALLNFQNKDVLQGAGTISNRQMEEFVSAVYEDFNRRRKSYEARQADKNDELHELGMNVEKRMKK